MRATVGDSESARLERCRQWTSAAGDGGLTSSPKGEAAEREPTEMILDGWIKQCKNHKEIGKTYIMNGN